MKYRKKPVVIEAVQLPDIRSMGTHSQANVAMMEFEEILKGLGANFEDGWKGRETKEGLCIVIPTLEGEHLASPGDWIIRGVKGEFYPCKPDIFEATYEPVEEQAA